MSENTSEYVSLTERRNQYKLFITRTAAISPDPFGESLGIDRRIKLSPIIVKERSSPILKFKDKKFSIKIPEVTKEGNFRLNHHFLPDIKSKKYLKAGSPTVKCYSGLLSPLTEKSLKPKNNFFLVKANSEKGHILNEDLNVSFGIQ